MCVPGLKIVSPASPAEAFGLLAAAIRDNDPVLVFEHKALYARKEEAPEEHDPGDDVWYRSVWLLGGVAIGLVVILNIIFI